MRKESPIYTSLCTLFAVLIVTGNLVYQKFVTIPLLPPYSWELSVGALSYPLTFLITDLITEFYGKAHANFCVRLGIVVNVLIAFLLIGFDKLEATSWSPLTSLLFHKVFGFYNIAFMSSLVACYLSQSIDIRLYLWIRGLTGEKWLWLRNNASTAVSLLADTLIVISFMTFFKIIPLSYAIPTFLSSYSFKLLFTLFSTPFFYIAVKLIKYLQNQLSVESKKGR